MAEPAFDELGIPPLTSAAIHPSVGAKLKGAFTLMRPHQWTKNFVCFAGLFFAGKALIPTSIAATTLAFFAFCFAASFVYTLNDIFDRKKDRAHPTKCFRPIPAGRITVVEAAIIGILSLNASILLCFLLHPTILLFIASYIALNFSYTLWLKNKPLVDVMIIASGFILRILVGTEAVYVTPSAWIILCAFFLSLFLGFGKRRAELQHCSATSAPTRRVLSQYSVTMLDRFCNMFATLSIAAYALFTVTARADHTLLITCPAVIFGLLRYLYLIEQQSAGESPDLILLQDRPLQAAIALWVVLTSLVLYSRLHLNIL